MDKIISIPYAKCVKMESPYKSDDRVVYHLFINVMDMPENIPTEVNPREVNPRTKVYKRIVDGLTEDNQSFYINNRGILISAKGKLKIDLLNKNVDLNIGNGSSEDNSKYGILDGGHTYHAIIRHRSSSVKQYVHLEVVTQISNIDELSSARNTSVQVSDKAIAELANKFKFVKDAIKNEPYHNDIGYKQNEEKRLDAMDLVRLMYMFNIKEFNEKTNSHPISAYSGKSQVLKDYLKKYGEREDSSNPNNEYLKLAELLPTMTNLYDTIQQEMKDGYNGTLFGKVKGVEPKKNAKTKFYNRNMDYQITAGLIYPMVAAFRALVEEDNNGNYIWVEDPIKVWEEIKEKLVMNTIEMSRSLGNNPQSAGKNTSLWAQNYDAVNTKKLQIRLARLTN